MAREYQAWLKKLNAMIERRFGAGCAVDTMFDTNDRIWFEDGLTPSEAFREFVREMKSYGY